VDVDKIMAYNYGEFLRWKYTGYTYTIQDDYDYDTLEWSDSRHEKPSKESIETKLDLIALSDAKSTPQAKRAAAYPPIEEQLDMLWHAMASDLTKRLEPFYSTIKAIKDRYPKT
jgi:hypothetical protein